MNLPLLQLGDSALPIGGYSHSWGLEAAIDRQKVKEAASLERWVRLWLLHAAGPFEGVAVAAACRVASQADWSAVVRANQLLEVGLSPPMLRQASRDMGEQLLALAEAWPWAADNVAELRQVIGVGAWHHAPVFGTLADAAGAVPREALLTYLHQAALGVISAGVRAVPVGHTHGQQILARLHNDIGRLAGELADRDLETAGNLCPAYEGWCHAQSRLYTRLFRS
jgi:urease accessory protein